MEGLWLSLVRKLRPREAVTGGPSLELRQEKNRGDLRVGAQEASGLLQPDIKWKMPLRQKFKVRALSCLTRPLCPHTGLAWPLPGPGSLES